MPWAPPRKTAGLDLSEGQVGPLRQHESRRAARCRRGGGAIPKRAGFRGVAYQFAASLEQLLGVIASSQPHFVRCINPNTHKQPNSFTGGRIGVHAANELLMNY